jgi:glycosyltransferase involved in cell wall biosynthesis
VGALEALRERGVEIVFVSLRDSTPLSDEIAQRGFKTLALGSRSRADLLLQVARLRRLARREKIDIIHGNESIQGCIAALGAKGLPEVPVIFHRHHVTPLVSQRIFSRLATRLSRMTIAVSAAAAEAAERIDGCPRKNIRIVHNGVPVPRKVSSAEIKEARTRLGVNGGDLVLTLIGHLRPEKGHLVLFEAMRLLTDEFTNTCHAVIVGGGPGDGAYRQASANMAHRVHFVGHQDDVALWNALGDLTIVPSLSEPFGLVALEAMALGRPVVASRVGGLAEIIQHEITGLLVEPGNAEALAASIRALLMSQKRREQMGEAARNRFLESFTENRMVQGWLRTYEEVVEIG